MKEQIKKMKQELKEIARQIKEKKNQRNKENNGYVPGLLGQRIEFRHKHVAYCLVRGRKLEQVDSGNGLDMEYVNWIIKTMQPDSKEKLYVVVSEKLTHGQQAVQAAHAVAEFLKKNPYTQWSNGHLVLLKDSPSYGGDMRAYIAGPCERAEFVEPDLGNKVTAYAVFGAHAERAMKAKVLL